MALGENNTRYATLLCAFTVVVGYRKGIAMASLSLTKFCFFCPPNALYIVRKSAGVDHPHHIEKLPTFHFQKTR